MLVQMMQALAMLVGSVLGIGVATERAYWLAHNSSGGGTPPLPHMPYDR